MERILIVDDNLVNLELVRQMLDGEFQIDAAIDGLAAVESALRQTPDLILMDLSLPVLDGWGALRRLKEAPSTAAVAVVAVTAHAIKGDRERAIAAGFDEYVTKPIEEEELLRVVHWLLRRRQAGVPS